jgi:hypothetical protein
LTLGGIVIRERVNFCGTGMSRKRPLPHPMWCESGLYVPYIAVNEAELATSQRFGRDLFQTRSTR